MEHGALAIMLFHGVNSVQDRNLESVLLEALDDERKAEASYAAVIANFGQVRPFINIIDAESRHSASIERQLRRLDRAIPANRWEGKVAAPASLAAACKQAIEAEIENIALYDRLIPRISDATVRQVFLNLQSASRENHLPAFRRCLEREEGKDRRKGRGGCGAGRGRS